MFCMNCGAKISDEAKFCERCGASVTQTNQCPQKSCPGTAKEESVKNHKSTTAKPASFLDGLRSISPAQKKNFMIRIAALIVLVVLAAIIVPSVLNKTDLGDVPLSDLGADKITTTIPLGGSFTRNDLSITPVEVTYVTNEVGYDDYGDPYVAVVLDITSVSKKWSPEYEDVTFWEDGSAAFSQPRFEETVIKKGETARYTFKQPLGVYTGQTHLEMRLQLECKNGAVVNLHFVVDGVHEFFSETATGQSASIFDEYFGAYTGLSNRALKFYNSPDGYTLQFDCLDPIIAAKVDYENGLCYFERNGSCLTITLYEVGVIELTCSEENFEGIWKHNIDSLFYINEYYGPDYVPNYTVTRDPNCDPNTGLPYSAIYGMTDFLAEEFTKAHQLNGSYYYDTPIVWYSPGDGTYILTVTIYQGYQNTPYMLSAVWDAQPNEKGGTSYYLLEWNIIS